MMAIHPILSISRVMGTTCMYIFSNFDTTVLTCISYSRNAAERSGEIARCEAAENCEVYDSPTNGKSIRFKANMGPGSEWYTARFGAGSPFNETKPAVVPRGHGLNRLQKRATPQTSMYVAQHRVNYGTMPPESLIHEMLYNNCHQNGCSTSNRYKDTQIVRGAGAGYSGTRRWRHQLIVRPEGQYNNYDDRNHFIEALKRIAVQHQKVKKVDYYSQYYNAGQWVVLERGSQNEHEDADHFALSKWSQASNGYFMGNMGVYVSVSDLGNFNGGCGAVTTAGNALTGGALGWFFGLAALFCV